MENDTLIILIYSAKTSLIFLNSYQSIFSSGQFNFLIKVFSNVHNYSLVDVS